MVQLLAALLALVASTTAISAIHAKGSKLFTDDGSQFYIKGIAYQLIEDDPLIDNTQCTLDASLMQTIGANSIRVYHVDPTANHDACMATFAAAGIYAWIDLDTTGTYIYADGMPPTWNETQYHAYQKVMDAFHSYDNVAGFFVGNEMLTLGPDSVAAPYIKAAARDMKAYRDDRGYRRIPVGYSAADISQLRPNLQNYLACGDNAAEALDFYSLNAYEWCGETTYDVSGYDMLQQNASGYNIPIFFSETGCNTPAPRTFADQSAILGPEMEDTWSGAIIYEWIEEANNYGLVSFGPPADPTATGANIIAGYTRAGTPTPIAPDFGNLASQWATLSPSGIKESDYKATETPPACPSYTAGFWEVSGNVPLPTIGAKGIHYTTGRPSKGTATGSAASASSTSSSSAASPTRAPSFALRKGTTTGVLANLTQWHSAHPFLSSAVYGLGVCVAFVVGA